MSAPKRLTWASFSKSFLQLLDFCIIKRYESLNTYRNGLNNRMAIDWNAISSISTAVASVATAIGVLFGAWKIRLSKKQAQAEFEDSMDQQYRSLSMDLPVDVLIGKEPTKDESAKVRELVFNYLDLSNEQVYLRAKGRISKYTWASWCLGIKAHLERPAFKQVFDEVRDNSGFTYLERLVDSKYESDLDSWFN